MRSEVVVIGAGPAGLAMSRCLSERGVDHVVVEAGTVAHAWRTQRWDSLRLLTPNWMSRLPGYHYSGHDPDGYMTATEVTTYLEGYHATFRPPVRTHTTVSGVRRRVTGFRVQTDQGAYDTKAVVVATGATGQPHRPSFAGELPASLYQLTPQEYRSPTGLPDGPVLVVGASASGTQIADELCRHGRDVTLAVGQHIRVPRSYRGRDVHWWLDSLGDLDQRHDQVDDLARLRRLPSLQLIGSASRRDLDLNELAAAGVQITGRVAGLAGSRIHCSGGLANLVASADLKQDRLLDRIDAAITARGWDSDLPHAYRPERTRLPAPVTELDAAAFATVVWATGYRPCYPWLEPELLDRRGQIPHDGGVATTPGLYVLGLPFTRRRKSNFLDGVGPDAWELSEHVVTHALAPLHRSGAPAHVPPSRL